MENFTARQQTVKVEELYRDTKRWKSCFHFNSDEMLFLERLLNSYVFEPNTPNLFERLRDFHERLKKSITVKSDVTDRIRKHEANLGGMLQCTDSSCDLEYYSKHEQLKAEVTGFQEDFRQLKSEIFNYAGGILKKRKPTD